MATNDNSLLGLRAQILDNFCYLNPLYSRPIIVTTYEEHGHEALIIEPTPARRILMHSQPYDRIEQALKELLRETSRLISHCVRASRHPETNLCIRHHPDCQQVKQSVEVKPEPGAVNGSN